MAWTTPLSDANSWEYIRGLFSNNLRTSFRTVELIRGAYFHSSVHDYPPIDMLGAILVSQTLLEDFFRITCPWKVSVLFFYTLQRSTTRIELVLFLYIYFETILPSACVVHLLNARTTISISHILFLTYYLSFWKNSSWIVEYCTSCSRFSYIELYSKIRLSDDRTKKLVKNKKRSMCLTLISYYKL